jgi:hypothetical protein
MVDHQQIALERERRGRGEDDDAVGWGDDRRAGRAGDVDPRMIGARFARIDALRSEHAADPAGGTGQIKRWRQPSLAVSSARAAAIWSSSILRRARNSGVGVVPRGKVGSDSICQPCGVTASDGAGRCRRRARASIAGNRGRVAVEGDQEAAVGGEADRPAVEAQRPGAGRHRAGREAALFDRARQMEIGALDDPARRGGSGTGGRPGNDARACSRPAAGPNQGAQARYRRDLNPAAPPSSLPPR